MPTFTRSWFQSWYNFKGRQGKMTLQPLDYTGGKLNDQVKYANNLAQLGKTPMTSQERALLVGNVTVIGLPNKVFLYDIAQVGDKNATRSARFRRDLAEFVGIKELSPDVPHNGYDVDPPGFVPIDICHYKYRPIRAELMEVARGASVWIREYFLKSPDVIVSSREFLEEQLLTWMEDPCEQTIDFGTDY